MGIPSVSDTTTKIVSLIGQCVVDTKVQPVDLRYGSFKRWLRQTYDLTSAEMREVEAHIASVGHFTSLRDAFFASAPSVGRIEALELKSVAKLGRAANNVLANEELFLSTLEKRLTSVFKTKSVCKPFGYSLKKSQKAKPGDDARVLNLLLSDLHFGSNLDLREVPYRYGFVEEARRLASVVKRTCDFKRDYRDQTELAVWLGGDLIKGVIHDMCSGLALAEQVADATWLLRQALVVLAGEFKKVTVYCSTGNHDRNPLRHTEGRATDSKWDSYATSIYFSVKLAVSHLPNVRVHIPRTPFVEYSPFEGQRFYLTHGDSCLNVGNPGKSVNIAGLEAQMLRINSGEVARGLVPYSVFVVGHVHTPSMTHLATGTLVTNGCLTPPDAFSGSIGYTSTRNGQWMWESTKGRLVGDARFLEVDENTDKDASLDTLIACWSGEF